MYTENKEIILKKTAYYQFYEYINATAVQAAQEWRMQIIVPDRRWNPHNLPHNNTKGFLLGG